MNRDPQSRPADRPCRLRRLLPAVLLAACVGLFGCIPSLNPLYTAKDLVFDGALVERWAEKSDSKDAWTFVRRDATSYSLTITEGTKSSRLVAHLLQLGQHRFLDLCADNDGLEQMEQCEDFFKASLIRGHLFLKVTQVQPMLRMSLLDGDWLEKMLKTKPRTLSHLEMEGGGYALTASTKELQRFVIRYADTESAWGKPTELARQPEVK